MRKYFSKSRQQQHDKCLEAYASKLCLGLKKVFLFKLYNKVEKLLTKKNLFWFLILVFGFGLSNHIFYILGGGHPC